MGGWVGGGFRQIIKQFCGPSCKLRLARTSAELSLQDGPSVAIPSLVAPCLPAAYGFVAPQFALNLTFLG